MNEVAAFLVVVHKHAHPESVEATMDAVRQLKNVAGIQTLYNDVGTAITSIRSVRTEVRQELEDVAAQIRAAGGA